MTNREDGYMTTGCTNWSKYDVPTIWSTVSDEGDSVSYAQVTAWRETSEAIDRHRGTLQEALHDLRVTWPAEESDAAQAFYDNVNSILLIMERYAAVAATNSVALLDITNALNTAKDKVQLIQQEWTKKSTAQASESGIEKALDVASFWSNKYAWRADLNRKAAAIMVDTDGAVSDGRRHMEAPDAYAPPRDTRVLKTPNSHGPASSYANHSTDGPQQPPVIPPLNASNLDQGIRLTSIASNLAPDTATPIVHHPNPSAPTSIADPFVVRSTLRNSPDLPSTTGLRGLPNTKTTGTPAEESTGTTRPNNTVGRNGIIGGETIEPGFIAGGGTRTGNSTSPARRINEPGGVIGSSGQATPSGRVHRSTGGRKELASSGPEDPWLITEGTSPVISANADQHEHTAGPGVIGIDR